MERLPQMLRGLRRHLGESERKVCCGVAPQMLGKALSSGLSEISPAHANVRAAMACTLQGLTRVFRTARLPQVPHLRAGRLS